jgi:hypothetical protein
VQIPQEDDVKNLRQHLDKRLNWHKYMFTKGNKKESPSSKCTGYLYASQNSLQVTNFSYNKAILKPIWTYGIQLWGMASHSNIDILERFQSKAFRMIVDATWYVPNTVIRRDLQTPTLK